MRSTLLAPATAFLLVLTSGAQAQFLSLPQYDNGVSLNSFVQADINKDGKSDIVGIRSVAPPAVEITVLLGNGTGGFDAPLNTTITEVDNVAQYQFRLADFNGDGRLDVAVFGTDHVTGQTAVAVLLGNGNGTFQAGRETVLGNVRPPLFAACSSNAGDYNGDGKMDIAYLSDSATLNVLLGKGDGTFSPPSTTSAAFGCLATGDFNNDKKLDLAAATGGGNISMLLGKGDGTFQSPVGVGKGGSTIVAIVAAALNADGNLDLVALQGGSPPAVTVLLGDGTGHFPTKHTYNGPSGGYAYYPPIAVRDLNGDGHPDIAVLAGPLKARVLTILLNNGDGSFSPGKTYNGDGVNGVSINSGLLAADLNGDKKVDLAFSNGAGGVSVLLGNGNGTFKGNFAVPVPFYGTGVQVGGFNNDLKPDLVLSQSANILLGNGDGTFTLKNTSCLSSSFFSSLAIGDYNKDGKLDLAGPTNLATLDVIAVCLGNGDGTFTRGGNFDQGVSHGFALSGDFNHDGKLDLAASDLNGFSILLGNGDGTFQNGIPTGASGLKSFGVGDFNHDGKLDIAAPSSSGIAVFLGNGDGTFKGPIVSPGPTFGLVTVTDLNKDGKLDLVVAGQGGPVTLLLGKGDGTFQAPLNYKPPGSSSTGAVIADFNLDGHLDVAVGTLSGVVGVFFGDGTGKLSTTPTTFRVGDPINGLATSDFNGDTKPDLAVLVRDGYLVTLLHQ